MDGNCLDRTPSSAPGAGRQAAVLQDKGGRAPWRTAGAGLASLGPPIGIGMADPLLGQIAVATELAIALTVIGTALFGSQARSERAFRLLRWIGNRTEPPVPDGCRCPRLIPPPRNARATPGRHRRREP